MNDRYVILNCPTLMGNRLCYSKTIKQCADCTDCLLKRIVEKCKDACKDCSNIKRTTYTQCKNMNNCKTARILKLLDIEECE